MASGNRMNRRKPTRAMAEHAHFPPQLGENVWHYFTARILGLYVFFPNSQNRKSLNLHLNPISKIKPYLESCLLYEQHCFAAEFIHKHIRKHCTFGNDVSREILGCRAAGVDERYPNDSFKTVIICLRQPKIVQCVAAFKGRPAEIQDWMFMILGFFDGAAFKNCGNHCMDISENLCQ